jgi:hypothetical protein|tara:strand:+ start:666 stop:932 length:267 start_codon:yes stop_codon:yes gene_type:complete
LADKAEQQKEILAAYKNVFIHSPDGQIVLRDLMKTSGMFEVTGIRDNAEIQHRTGTQDMVRRIFSILSLSDEQIYSIATIINTGEEDG